MIARRPVHAALACLAIMSANAQQPLIPPVRLLYGPAAEALAGVEIKSLRIGGTPYTQVAVPLAAVIPAGDRLSLRIGNTPFRTASDSLSGFMSASDTHAGASWFDPENGMLVMMDMNIPMGRAHARREKHLLDAVTGFEAFGYQVQSTGHGFDLQAGGAWATPLSDRALVTVGAVYLARGRYQPVDTLGTFFPGNEMTLAAGCEFRFGRRGVLSTDLAVTVYADDRLQSVDLSGRALGDPFALRRPAPRMTVTVRYAAVTDAGARHEINGALRVKTAPDRITLSGIEVRNGPQIELRYAAVFPFATGSPWSGRVLAHAASYASSDYIPPAGPETAFHDAFIASPGLGLSYDGSGAVRLDLSARWTFGSARLSTRRRTVSGWTLGTLATVSI